MTDESQIKWSKTQQGKPMLVLKGFNFRVDGKPSKKNNTTSYRCCYNGCKGSITLHNETGKIISSIDEHIHSEQTEGQVAARMAQREIYERSRDFDANPVEIIHAVTATLPECAHPHMPSDNILRRNITAITSKMGPKTPRNLSELKIPEKFRLNEVGEDWLFYESPIDYNDPDSRIFLFGTRKMLGRLSDAEVC